MAPAALAVLIASVTIEAAPLPEPAFPARSRIPAITGAPCSVQIVVTSGDSPRRRTCFPAIFVCPNLAPCLACPNTGRSSESMSMNARCCDPRQQTVCPTRLTRCARSTDANCRVWPWVNSRRNCPNVVAAYTPANRLLHPTGADHVQIVDAVRPAGHPRDDRGQLPGRVRARLTSPGRVRVESDLLGDQLRQAGPFGQRQHRRQPRVRHEVGIIEQRRGSRPRIR